MTRRLTILDLKKLAKSRNAELVSTEYLNAHQKLKWKCFRGHIFNISQSNFKSRNSWCSKCTTIGRFEEIKKVAKLKKLKCLSKEYMGSDKKLKWKCNNGHIIFRSPDSLRQNTGCYECYGNPPLSLSLINKHAKEKGVKCISKTYKNVYTNLKWQCSKGHTWEAQYRAIKNNAVWCVQCNKDIQFKNLKEIARKKKGKLLSKKFVKVTTTYHWQCEKGHKWKIGGDAINSGSWCGECAGNISLGINAMHSIAKKRGGKCLSKKYLGAHKKLIWQCKEGHVWSSAPVNIVHGKSWCSKCHFYFSEEICRTTFEQIFKTKFPKTRPAWLIGPKGFLMELDGYSKKYGIAYEYHGSQHFKKHIFTKNDDVLKESLKRDKKKLEICKKNKVKLIVITYKQDLSKLSDFIKNKTKSLNLDLKKINFNKEINFDKIYMHKSIINELQLIAKKKDGKCLSKKYFGARIKLKWQCSKGHSWFATPDNVKSKGRWCRKCYGTSPLSIDEMHKLAEKKGGKCLSKKYINSKSKLKWQCSEGHTWLARPYSVKLDGSWCRKCYFNRMRTQSG